MSTFVGPFPDTTCTVCEERLIRVDANDSRHPWCDEPALDVVDELVVRALLTLGASGAGAEVVSALEVDQAEPVSVPIRTEDLHDAVHRRAAYDEAAVLAVAAGCEVEGDYLTGPQIVGDVNAREVTLVWQTRTRRAADAQDEAALALGRLWGRQSGLAVLRRGAEEMSFIWPVEWADAVTEYADGGCEALPGLREIGEVAS